MMLQKLMRRLIRMLLSLGGIGALCGLWEFAPRLGLVNPRYLPCFSLVMEMLRQMWLSGEFYIHVMVSLWRVIIGLLLAMGLALPLGLALRDRGNPLTEGLNPLLRLMSQANPLSLMPLFILVFGIGESAKLAIVAWICFWPVLFNTLSGFRLIEPALIKTGAALAIGKWALAYKILLPAAAPFIFSGIKIGLQLAFFMLVAGEMIAANAGLGYLLHLSATLNQTTRMYAASFGIVILGFGLNCLLELLQKNWFFWQEPPEPLVKPTQPANGRLSSRYAFLIVTLIMGGIIILGGFQVQRTRNYLPGIHNHSGSPND